MGGQSLPAASLGRAMMGWLRAYAASDDPFVAAANFLALMLAWNQPFYPLYLWFILGADAWVGLPEIASGLAFFAIPALTRLWPWFGRAALPVLGVANTVMCIKLLGEASGVGLFLLPCAMLAAILFRAPERWGMAALTALPLAVWLAVRGRLGAPPVVFATDQYEALFTMSVVSVGCLMVVFGWVLAGIHRRMLDASRSPAASD